MYLKFGLRVLYYDFNTMLIMSKNVAKESGRSRLYVIIDSLISVFKYGTLFTEYQAMSFIFRPKENRKTILTVGEHLRLLKKYNGAGKSIFLNKTDFNEVFNLYLGREWINANKASEEEIKRFISKHRPIVMKIPNGCSGKQVYVTKLEDGDNEILKKIKEGFILLEECIQNCQEIKALNPTSLNTIRIVTVQDKDYFDIICASLRIGAKGSKVDNISMGGTAARVDIKTGTLCSEFRANKYRQIETSQIGRDERGFVIPFWNETMVMVKNASKLVPDVHIVGWDVAITPNGPSLIEGNDSFDSSLLENYALSTETGIKDKFLKSLANVKL